jgi:hypothetical protein
MMSDEQILELGFEALVSKLGPVGMIRFIHQFDTGKGNYTEDRHQWLEVSDVETLAKQIQQEDITEYKVKALSPIIEQRQDDAKVYIIPNRVWTDLPEEENLGIDFESEDIDQSIIGPFHIDSRIQGFATPSTG